MTDERVVAALAHRLDPGDPSSAAKDHLPARRAAEREAASYVHAVVVAARLPQRVAFARNLQPDRTEPAEQESDLQARPGGPTRFLTIAAARPPATRRPQTPGATPRGLNPGCCERIRNSRRTNTRSSAAGSRRSIVKPHVRRTATSRAVHWLAFLPSLFSAQNFFIRMDTAFRAVADIPAVFLHESSLARTMPTDRILACRCDTTLVGRGCCARVANGSNVPSRINLHVSRRNALADLSVASGFTTDC